MGRFLAVLLPALLVVACQNQSHPVFSPQPTLVQHTAPVDAILQTGDVTADLSPCLGSGPMDVYVTTLTNSDPTLGARVSAQWAQLKLEGATAGAISLFAGSPAACKAELAAGAGPKSLASFVAIFPDSGQADRAWQAGVFGFAPPAPGEVIAGVTRGVDTGLGVSSWTIDRTPVHLACWHKSVYVAFLASSNLDATTVKAATAAVDARLN